MATAAGASCPSDAELVRLRDAVPGDAPPELARHLAECERCQQRVLFGAGPRPAKRPMPEWPTPQRILLLALAVVVALAMLLVSLQRLAAVFR